MNTDLTFAQHARLDALAAQDPAAVVVKWDAILSGPVIRRGDGRLQVLSRVGRLHVGRRWSEAA